MALYENVFIARPDISAAQVDGLVERFSALVAENGGAVHKKEYWGLRSLTYRIKKNRKGHYALLNLDCPPAAVKELERNMRISEDILRYLTVRVDELEEGQSMMLQNRGARDDRGRRGDRDRGGFRDRDRDRDRGDRDRGDRDRGDRDAPAERRAESEGADA
ncbi:MAG: 30S ribosomal protein S6 [Rhodospirillales bacterium]